MTWSHLFFDPSSRHSEATLAYTEFSTVRNPIGADGLSGRVKPAVAASHSKRLASDGNSCVLVSSLIRRVCGTSLKAYAQVYFFRLRHGLMSTHLANTDIRFQEGILYLGHRDFIWAIRRQETGLSWSPILTSLDAILSAGNQGMTEATAARPRQMDHR